MNNVLRNLIQRLSKITLHAKVLCMYGIKTLCEV